MSTERLHTEYTADTRDFRRGAQVYDRELARQQRLTNERLTRIDRRWERSTRAILRSRTALVGLGGALGLSQVREYAEAWRNVERRLASIGVTSEGAKQDLVDLAVRTRSAVEGTAEAVQRMAKSTDGDFDKAARRVETLQKLLASGGASGSERASVSLQLGQALKSGRLSGDEFRSISENAPVELLDALARSAGITRAELKAFAQAQKLTTDIVLHALDGLATQADASFKTLALSGEEAFDVLRTGMVSYIGRVDQVVGATASINGAMASFGEYLAGNGEHAETFAEALGIVTNAALALAGGRGLGAIVAALAKSREARQADVALSKQQVAAAQVEMATARKRLDIANQRQRAAYAEGRAASTRAKADRVQIAAAQNLAAAHTRLTAATTAHAAAQKRLSMTARVTTASMRALRGVMAFFGGPLGLAMTGIAVAATIFANMKSDAEKLDDALHNLQGTVDRTSRVNDELKSDYAALTVANEKLEAAIRAGGQAAIDAATLDLAAVNDRIRANETLRKELSTLAQVQLAEAKSHLAELERAETDSARRRMRDRLNQDRTFLQRMGNPFQKIDAAELDAFITKERELIQAAAASGRELTTQEKATLEAAVAAAEAAARVAELEDNVAALTGAAPALASGLNQGAAAAANLGTQAMTAAEGVRTLMKMIPELANGLNVQEGLAKAATARDAALAGLNDIHPERRAQEAQKINAIYAESIRHLTGIAAAEERREAAAKAAIEASEAYARDAEIGAMEAKDQALAREEQRYQAIVKALTEARVAQVKLDEAEAAYQQRRAQIETDFNERGAGGGGGGGGGGTEEAREALRLFEDSLSVNERLRRERERLRALLPELIALGLDHAQAEAVIAEELKKVQKELEGVTSRSRQAAESFAQGVLSDIRHADSLGDAIGRISDKLWDLALDPVFKYLSSLFADLVLGGGGWFAKVLGPLFSANGNAFNSAGVVPFKNGGVVDRPTMFNFAGNRTGVMGEAGPEAILPLQRGPGGKLGVIAELPPVPTGGVVNVQNSTQISFGDILIQSQSDQPEAVAGEVVGQFRSFFSQMFGAELQTSIRAGGVLDRTFKKKGQ